MAVLKHTSPTAWPVAPSPEPSNMVPSASTSSAVAFGSAQESSGRAASWDDLAETSTGCFSVIERLHLPASAAVAIDSASGRRDFARGHSRAARRDQHRPEGGDEGPRRAPG